MESGFHRPARKSGFLFWSRYIHVTVPVRLHCSATANRQSLQVVGIRGLRYAPPETGCPYVGNAASRLPLPREHCGLTRDLGKACGRAPAAGESDGGHKKATRHSRQEIEAGFDPTWPERSRN